MLTIKPVILSGQIGHGSDYKLSFCQGKLPKVGNLIPRPSQKGKEGWGSETSITGVGEQADHTPRELH